MREPGRRTSVAEIGVRLTAVRGYFVLFFGALLVYGFSPVVMNGDSFLLAPTTAGILDGNGLDIARWIGPGTNGGVAWIQSPDGTGTAVAGRDIKSYLQSSEGAGVFNYFPWVPALLVVPLALAFELAGALGIRWLDFDQMVRTGETGAFNLAGAALLGALTVIAIARFAEILLTARLGPRARTIALRVGAVAAFGTPIWSTLSRTLWSQTAATLMISLALVAAATLAVRREPARPRTALLLGLFAAAAYTCRPTSLIPAVVLAAWFVATYRRDLRLLGAALVGTMLVAIPWVAVNIWTFGTWQPPYYNADRMGFAATFGEAMLGNLISPNRGLLVFCPVVLVALWGAWRVLRGDRTLPVGLAVVSMTVVLLHYVAVSGSKEGWWAGSAIGPRFMADLVPFFVVLALPAVAWLVTTGGRPARAAVAALVVISVAMNGLGATTKPAACWNLDPVNVDTDPARVWDWSDPQVVRPFVVLSSTGSVRQMFLQTCANLPAAPDA